MALKRNEKTKLPCLELRRFETIYRTFVKMKPNEMDRVINFLYSRYLCDVKKERKQDVIKINPLLNVKKKPLKKTANYINAKKYLKNEKTKDKKTTKA